MTDKMVEAYLKALESEERAAASIEKYRRALLSFAAFLSGAAVTPEMIHLWKDDLRASNYAPSTINACLAAVNGFFCFCGWTDCRARFLKIQRRLFRDSRQELTRGEYERLVAAAEAAGDRGLALLMETVCSTGIRVSEVQYITVEAAKNGKTEIALKGKIRTILLPSKLCRKLLKYAARQKTASGAIFRAKSDKALSPLSNLVEDEEAVRPRRRRRRESFPAQFAPPVRDGVLSRIQGHRQAGGCSRAFEHRNDAHLPCHKRGRASASARAVEARVIGAAESIFCCAKMLKRIQLPLYSQLKHVQRSSCLCPRTFKWVQRHKLTVRFPL